MRGMNASVSSSILIVILASCASGPRLPSDTVALATPLALGPPPIYALIGYRQELDLTSEQIGELDAIAQDFEDENLPLVEELRRSGSQRSGPAGQIVVRAEAEETLRTIRENQKEAAESVRSLLTEEQRATVCRLYERPQGRGARRPPERTQRDTTEADQLVLRPVGWDWCSTETERAVGR